MHPTEELKNQMQQDIQSRLKKIEGQIRGLQGMIAADKDCEYVLTQARAAQAALKAVGSQILKVYLVKCYAGREKEQSPEAVFPRLEQAINMLYKFVD